MKILLLLIFISMMVMLGAVMLFALAVKNKDFDHADEISLLPLEDDADDKSRNNLQ